MPMMLRNCLRACLLVLLACAVVWCGEAVQEFVHISDTHVVALDDVHPKLVAAREHFRHSTETLKALLERLGRESPPAFVLNTGDLVDSYSFDGPSGAPVYGQIERFREALGGTRLQVFLALGNHDIHRYRKAEGQPGPIPDPSVAEEARRRWRQAFDCFRNGTYYSFRRQVGQTAYLFLVLDHAESPVRDREFAGAQLTWLKQQLAAHPHDTAVLAMHIPLGEDAFSDSLKAAITGANNVLLSLAGHRHSDAVEEIEAGGRRLTQVRTAALGYGADHWRRIRLLEDRVEITATGHPEQVVKTVAVAPRRQTYPVGDEGMREGWSRREDLNLRPAVYETAALPTELRRRAASEPRNEAHSMIMKDCAPAQ